MKGETPEELCGFARSLRARMNRVEPGPGPVVDTCGTGGDGLGTFNISTTAAFVAAAAGARVAKHGNRSISSQCGSADIFEGLGVRIDLRPEQMGECIRTVGIGFLFAPALHPAMKHAQPARLELKMRTVFNVLGPLANPAEAQAQLIGAFSPAAAALMAGALARLGTGKAFVVHGAGGLDEISTVGETLCFRVEGATVTRLTLTPQDFGLPQARVEDLSGGGREANVAITRSILDGECGPKRDIVLANASAALVAVGLARDFRHGVELGAAAIDSGAAREKVEQLALRSSRDR
jgi:anthranilate phosphoribosyltransferase